MEDFDLDKRRVGITLADSRTVWVALRAAGHVRVRGAWGDAVPSIVTVSVSP